MSDRAAVLFANDAFYTAFRLRDAAAMEGLWAEAHPVACIHPGWQALIGREAVVESWRSLFARDAVPQLVCCRPEVFLFGATATVICYEVIGSVVLVATNLFVREGKLWRMTLHQAGPCPLDAAAFEEEVEEGPLQ